VLVSAPLLYSVMTFAASPLVRFASAIGHVAPPPGAFCALPKGGLNRDPESISHRISDGGADSLEIETGVDHRATLGFGLCDLQEALSHALMKGPIHPLEPGFLAGTAKGTRNPYLHWEIEYQGEIGLEVGRDEPMQLRQKTSWQTAPIALIG